MECVMGPTQAFPFVRIAKIKKPHIAVRLLAPQNGLFSNQFWDELRSYATLDYLIIQMMNNREVGLILVILAIL